MKLHETLLANRGLVLAATVLVLFLGMAAWSRMPVDAFPDMSNQQVMILSEAPALGPLDVERQITFPIETVLGGLPDLKQVRSVSKTGLSQVVVVFEDHVDTYFARQLVFERLQMAREQLPHGVEPELGPISTGLGEVYQYTLKSDRHDLTELRTIQDWLVSPRLRSIPGVNEVNSFGGRVRQILVEVDPDRLLKYDLSLGEVVEALAAGNANAGGGFIVKHWEQENIRSVGLFGSPTDIAEVVLAAEDGTPVRVSDIATIREGHMTRMGAVSRDGEGEVAAGMVIMLKDENSKEVVERVKEALPAIESSLPEGVSLDAFYDRTDLVKAVIGTVRGALLLGGLLVILVLFLVLGNLRAALVAALSLPMTALFAFIFMGAAGVTANLMSLGGLAVAIGMVVDGSVVIVENTLRHLRDEGSLLERIARSTREVARPIAFSILIIVLVFLPLFSLEGMEGKMFRPLALTMIFAMLGSLMVALFVVPSMLATVFRGSPKTVEAKWLVRLRMSYEGLLSRSLDRSGLVLLVATLIFLGSLFMLPMLGTEFLPDLDEGAIAINVVRLPNAALDGSVITSGALEKIILAYPEVRTVVSKTGRAEISEDPMGPEQTDVLIMLHPEKEWTSGRSKEDLVEAMRAELEQVPGIRLAFSQPIALRVNELVSGVKSDLAVKIFGADIEALKEYADEAASVMRGIDGAQDVSVEQVAGFTQLEIIPDRQAMSRYQISIADLNELVETAVGGTVATELVDGQMRFGVRVRFPEDRRNSEEAILALLVPTPSGARVPLERIARLERVEGPAQISREQNMRRVVVESNVVGRDLGGFVEEVQERLSELEAELPPGYWLEFGGTFENQQRALKRLSIVVPISILLIFLMLVSALGSFRGAGIVMANLPFALVGAVAAMLIFRIDLSVPATVGIIALFGTAVQNGTVLMTFIKQLRDEGRELREAVLSACSLRFRALLMTALTTVLGLAPMLFAQGPGAEMQRPLAVVVIGGLFTSTGLTLLVLPSLYWRLSRSKSS
ncbi:efflux RND transporter permease subunit [bacterium]|nr:efflux RND transporter permease subunit [bacterium]